MPWGLKVTSVLMIREKKADYVLSLKANHPTLFCQVKEWFNTAKKNNFQGIEYDYEQKIEKGHHRTEKRYVWAVAVKQMGSLHQQDQWSGLQTIVMVERIRHLWNKTTKETQFYLTSLPPNARIISQAIRKYWTIENQVHWVLDVTFREDYCRIRSRYGAHNFSLLRRLALNALSLENTLKRSMKHSSQTCFYE